MPPSKTFKDYVALDGLRGYAVILVSLTHFVGFYALAYRGLSVDNATYFNVDSATDRLLLWLYLSMQSLYILLTISGYMVCRMVLRPNYAGWASFFVARAARIYPPLLFGLAFGVGIYAVLGAPVDLSWRNITYNVLTLNGVFEIKGQPYVFPSWSLFYEIVFCLMMPGFVAIAQRSRRSIATMFLLWATFLAALGLVGFSGWPLFAPFVVGCLLAQVSDDRIAQVARRLPSWSIVVAYCLVASLPSTWAPLPTLNAGIQFSGRYVVFIVLACLMSAALISKVVYAPGPLQRLFAYRPLVSLGKMSYSFYMLHAPLIFMAFTVFVPLVGRWSETGGLVHFSQVLAIFWAMSLAASWLGYYGVEMIYFRSAMSSRSAKARALSKAADPVISSSPPGTPASE